jgi:hypothetical protein
VAKTPSCCEPSCIKVPTAERENLRLVNVGSDRFGAFECRAGLGKVSTSLRQPAEAASRAKYLRRTRRHTELLFGVHEA